ncbi:hypothetical protein ACC810_38365, partial [Rhizobium ruizarguesonis]
PYADEELHRQRTKFWQMEFEIKVDTENLEHISVRGDKGWFVVENKVDIARNLSLAEWIVARELDVVFLGRANPGVVRRRPTKPA